MSGVNFGRGGYLSSDRSASSLPAPPSGPAPGMRAIIEHAICAHRWSVPPIVQSGVVVRPAVVHVCSDGERHAMERPLQLRRGGPDMIFGRRP